MKKLNIKQKRILDLAIRTKTAPKTIDLDMDLYNKVKNINSYGYIHNDINKYLRLKNG